MSEVPHGARSRELQPGRADSRRAEGCREDSQGESAYSARHVSGESEWQARVKELNDEKSKLEGEKNELRCSDWNWARSSKGAEKDR